MEHWRTCTRHDRYEVSDLGRVRRADTGRVLMPCRQSRGYLKVCLGRRVQAYVHQLVAEAFLGPRPAGHDVDHIDWDKSNNRASNLRWLDSAVNAIRWKDRVNGKNIWRLPGDPPDEEVPIFAEGEWDEIQAELEAAGW